MPLLGWWALEPNSRTIPLLVFSSRFDERYSWYQEDERTHPPNERRKDNASNSNGERSRLHVWGADLFDDGDYAADEGPPEAAIEADGDTGDDEKKTDCCFHALSGYTL
jgi:hypothetical protein